MMGRASGKLGTVLHTVRFLVSQRRRANVFQRHLIGVQRLVHLEIEELSQRLHGQAGKEPLPPISSRLLLHRRYCSGEITPPGFGDDLVRDKTVADEARPLRLV
jgi:hypothetical protein